MAITPLEIQHKEFTVRMKGYDKEQVDDFLDVLKKELEQVNKENRELQKQIQFAEEKIDHFQNLQDTLNKSIVVAQDAADRLKENARKEAEIILFEAEKSADRLLKEAAGKATKINQETEEVRRESRNFKQKLQLLVESQLNLIHNEEWNALLNAAPEKELETPTLNEVLMNRTRKVDDLLKESGMDETDETVTEVTENEEKTPSSPTESAEEQMEAIEISV